jgi:hypothetical protein
VEKFLAAYPESTKSKDADAILVELKAESALVLAGGVKMNGEMISPADYQANAYEIDSQISAASIRNLLKSRRTLQALRAFSVFDNDFLNTEVRRELVPLITQTINSYLIEVGALASSYDQRVKKRDIGLERMSGADRVTTERAIKEESAAQEAYFEREKAAAIGWVLTHPFCKPTLDDTLSFGSQELSRINTSESDKDGGKLFRDALTLIKDVGDDSAISAAISAAESAKVAPRYIEILKIAARNKDSKP